MNNTDIKTIDNLGRSASERYAAAQALYDSNLNGDTRNAVPKAEIATIRPYVRTETLFPLSFTPQKPFAHFFPLPEEDAQPLTPQLLAHFFSSDSLDPPGAFLEKLSAFPESKEKKALQDFAECYAGLYRDEMHVYGQIRRLQKG